MRRVAIVGSGVAGVIAASFLERSGIDVVLYEKEAKLGGHADTRSVYGTDVGTLHCVHLSNARQTLAL